MEVIVKEIFVCLFDTGRRKRSIELKSPKLGIQVRDPDPKIHSNNQFLDQLLKITQLQICLTDGNGAKIGKQSMHF